MISSNWRKSYRHAALAPLRVDPALYSMLKDMRKKLSKKLEDSPDVIFQDPSLEAMASIYLDNLG